MMRVLTFATAASFVVMGSAVFAQAKPVTRSDYVNSLNARFSSMDTNHDGRITAAEHAVAAQAMFARMDANHDGYLSRAEIEAGHGMRKTP